LLGIYNKQFSGRSNRVFITANWRTVQCRVTDASACSLVVLWMHWCAQLTLSVFSTLRQTTCTFVFKAVVQKHLFWFCLLLNLRKMLLLCRYFIAEICSFIAQLKCFIWVLILPYFLILSSLLIYFLTYLLFPEYWYWYFIRIKQQTCYLNLIGPDFWYLKKKLRESSEARFSWKRTLKWEEDKRII